MIGSEEKKRSPRRFDTGNPAYLRNLSYYLKNGDRNQYRSDLKDSMEFDKSILPDFWCRVGADDSWSACSGKSRQSGALFDGGTRRGCKRSLAFSRRAWRSWREMWVAENQSRLGHQTHETSPESRPMTKRPWNLPRPRFAATIC